MSQKSAAAGPPASIGIRRSTVGPLVSPHPDAESVERCAARIMQLGDSQKDVLHTVLAYEDVRDAAAELGKPVREVIEEAATCFEAVVLKRIPTEEAATCFEAVVLKRIPTAEHKECVKKAFVFLAKGGKPDQKYFIESDLETGVSAGPEPETGPEPKEPTIPGVLPAPLAESASVDEWLLSIAEHASFIGERFSRLCPMDKAILLLHMEGKTLQQVVDELELMTHPSITRHMRIDHSQMIRSTAMLVLKGAQKIILAQHPEESLEAIMRLLDEPPKTQDVVRWMENLDEQEIVLLELKVAGKTTVQICQELRIRESQVSPLFTAACCTIGLERVGKKHRLGYIEVALPAYREQHPRPV